jgi:hypothetical protein
MESIGHILKAARERRQISIADVVVATKMTSTFVQAIEADDFNALVAPVYARGFIKLYAECVGLDPMPLQKQFDASRRAGPAAAPLPLKVPHGKVPVAYEEKLKPPGLQQSGPLPRHGATGKPEPEKIGGRSKAVGGVALAKAVMSEGGAHAPVPSLPPSWSVSLLAGRLTELNRLFRVCVQWPWFNLPSGVSRYFPLPGIVWRRIFIVAGVGLLIIAASLAWECSHRGLPSTTDACRWLAEPPAPYMTVEARAPMPSR